MIIKSADALSEGETIYAKTVDIYELCTITDVRVIDSNLNIRLNYEDEDGLAYSEVVLPFIPFLVEQ